MRQRMTVYDAHRAKVEVNSALQGLTVYLAEMMSVRIAR